MSLINKMLKDLDKRGGDTNGGDPSRASVKAVYSGNRSKGHPLIWISLLLLIVVCGALAWVMRDKLLKSLQPAAKQGPVPLISSSPPLVTATPPVSTIVAKPIDEPVKPGVAPQTTVVAPPRVATVVAKPSTEAPKSGAKPAASPVSAPRVAMAAAKPATTLPKPALAEKPVQDKNQNAFAQSEKAGAPAVKPRTARAKTPSDADGATKLVSDSALASASLSSGGATLPVAKRAKRGGVPVKATNQSKETTPQQQADTDYSNAIALIEDGRDAEAIAMLEGILVKQYKHAAARQTLAGLLIDAKRSNDAVGVLKDGLKIDSSQTGMAMVLARLQVERGENRAALTTLEQSLPYAKFKSDYRAFIAALYQRDNRHVEAIENYRVALGEAPDNGVWWMGYGISLQAVGRSVDARTAFTQARDSGKLTPPLKAFVEQRLAQLPQ
jgi:MSHA biogenesis protein MshN